MDVDIRRQQMPVSPSVADSLLAPVIESTPDSKAETLPLVDCM